MQNRFTYDGVAKISKNHLETNVELEDLSLLTPMRASVKTTSLGIEDCLFYIDFLNEQVFDSNFKNINDTHLGTQILEKVASKKSEKEAMAKIPFDIIQKAMKTREEKEKLFECGDFYGEN